MSRSQAIRNIGGKVARRLLSAHKPFVKLARHRAREGEQRAFQEEARAADREIARVAAGGAPIVAGPWLAEVGYEVLYWIPFLRWFRDAYRVPRERLIVLSRGGMAPLYRDIAGSYVDIYDHLTPAALTARNTARRAEHEGGGQKQSAASELDEELIALARAHTGQAHVAVCHPSLLFRLFRHVWHGNLPMDFFWTRTRYETMRLDDRGEHRDAWPGIPADYIAVKLYAGPAITAGTDAAGALRDLVRHAAAIAPVVLLDTGLDLDEHRDFDFTGIENVINARHLMTPANNLAVQAALIARSRLFLGTCGGLAWLAPFLGVKTIALYENDRLLAPHLFIARQAGRAAGAAEFSALDIRAVRDLRLLDDPRAPRRPEQLSGTG